MSISYRPEIDGLRAIAVVAVVLYHAGIGSAGFVGVDIFFVISGYLITALLLREHQATGRIDLPAFYARRVRRIFPAAVAVVLATLAAASLLLPPADFVHAANSAGAAAVFGANVFFQFVTGGYFDARSEEMPLLHLWSLSVEEQFYFLWPALLLAVLRWRPEWLKPALIALALASFALAEGLMRSNPEAAFYQMPARFWELGAGGIIAAWPARALPRWAATGGVLLTLAACAVPIGHFPGVGALPAVLGACLVIAAVHGGAGNAFLRSKPMVGVGLISYSLYLWHWPLLALYRATSIGEGSLAVRLELCAVAVVLAIASYRYIEQPFRRMRFPSWRTVSAGAAASLSLAVGACAWGYTARHSIRVDTPQMLAAAAAERDIIPRTCHAWVGDMITPKCPRSPKATVGIWGDSMAWSWTPLALKADPAAAIFTRDACGPYLGYLPAKAMPGDLNCRDFADTVPARVRGLETLVLAARWIDEPARFAGLRAALAAVAPHVGRVVIIGPTPHLREVATRCIAKGHPEACDIPRSEFDAAAAPILAELRKAAAAHPNVVVMDPSDRLCTATRCAAVVGGRALYWDTHHLTASTARSFDLPSRENPTVAAGAH